MADYFPVTLSRGEAYRFEVNLSADPTKPATSIASSTPSYEIYEDDDPESALLAVAGVDIVSDESGIYQHYFTEDEILAFDAAPVFGYGFLCMTTDGVRDILARGPVRVR